MVVSLIVVEADWRWLSEDLWCGLADGDQVLSQEFEFASIPFERSQLSVQLAVALVLALQLFYELSLLLLVAARQLFSGSEAEGSLILLIVALLGSQDTTVSAAHFLTVASDAFLVLPELGVLRLQKIDVIV